MPHALPSCPAPHCPVVKLLQALQQTTVKQPIARPIEAKQAAHDAVSLGRGWICPSGGSLVSRAKCSLLLPSQHVFTAGRPKSGPPLSRLFRSPLTPPPWYKHSVPVCKKRYPNAPRGGGMILSHNAPGLHPCQNICVCHFQISRSTAGIPRSL